MISKAEYCMVFPNGIRQYEKLVIVNGSHAHGKVFRVFVLPGGKLVEPSGGLNAPLNADAVEVYGVTGQDSQRYNQFGWIHEGPWMANLNTIYIRLRQEQYNARIAKAAKNDIDIADRAAKIALLLSSY